MKLSNSTLFDINITAGEILNTVITHNHLHAVAVSIASANNQMNLVDEVMKELHDRVAHVVVTN